MIDTSHWTATSFHRLSELPLTSGVYIVETDKPLYVGKSSNMKLRWKGHSQAMALALAGAQELRWKEFPKEMLASVEAELIEQFKPVMNMRTERIAEKKPMKDSPAAFEGSGYRVKADCWRCLQCGHVWLANVWKEGGAEPSHCARCKSRKWNQDMGAAVPVQAGCDARIPSDGAALSRAKQAVLAKSCPTCHAVNGLHARGCKAK